MLYGASDQCSISSRGNIYVKKILLKDLKPREIDTIVPLKRCYEESLNLSERERERWKGESEKADKERRNI